MVCLGPGDTRANTHLAHAKVPLDIPIYVDSGKYGTLGTIRSSWE